MNRDAKIGLLAVMVFAALMLASRFRDRGILTFNDEVGLLFTQVHGLRAGDPVTIGGVPAGRVAEIDFAPQEIQDSFVPITGGTTLVRALVNLDGGRRIPKESTYVIRVDLNGRRWLDITLSPSADYIGPDENFFAEEAFGQDDQMQRTILTFRTLTEQTEQLRDELTSPEFMLRTKDTASNLRFYSRELVAASGEAPRHMAEFDESLDRQELLMLQQIRAFDEKTQEVARRMTEMAPQMSETLQGWSIRMERQGDRLGATLQMAGAKSEEYQKLLDEAVSQQLKPEVVDKLVKQARRWSRKLQEYRYLAEDLHSLTSDPTIRADLKKAIDDFRIKTEELNEKLLKLEKNLKENPFTGPLVDESQLEQP
jgi:type III secretion system FlhB-like substrate exporter